uniref:Uncharacterized protein n=1 Tax=Rhizophora mucronata TaxID=61149 RepID=A0A2P2NPL0_RHIMU
MAITALVCYMGTGITRIHCLFLCGLVLHCLPISSKTVLWVSHLS